MIRSFAVIYLFIIHSFHLYTHCILRRLLCLKLFFCLFFNLFVPTRLLFSHYLFICCMRLYRLYTVEHWNWIIYFLQIWHACNFLSFNSLLSYSSSDWACPSRTSRTIKGAIAGFAVYLVVCFLSLWCTVSSVNTPFIVVIIESVLFWYRETYAWIARRARLSETTFERGVVLTSSWCLVVTLTLETDTPYTISYRPTD